MGIGGRRDREKQELKQAILAAAQMLAAKTGWAKVTMRKVAEQIEYSPPTIYEHFQNKEAIITELARRGFRQLLMALQTVDELTISPEEKFLRMSKAYWDFAWQSPELYQIMYGLTNTHPSDNSWPEAKETFRVLHLTVQAVMRVEYDAPELHDALLITWSLTHGMLSLALESQLDCGPERAAALLQQALRDLMTVWRSRKVS